MRWGRWKVFIIIHALRLLWVMLIDVITSSHLFSYFMLFISAFSVSMVPLSKGSLLHCRMWCCIPIWWCGCWSFQSQLWEMFPCLVFWFVHGMYNYSRHLNWNKFNSILLPYTIIYSFHLQVTSDDNSANILDVRSLNYGCHSSYLRPC